MDEEENGCALTGLGQLMLWIGIFGLIGFVVTAIAGMGAGG